MASEQSQPVNAAALIVGVNHYSDQRFSTLICAEDDGAKLAGLLRYKAGYATVKPLFGPSKKEIIDTATLMVRKLKAGGLFLFYFAGHGVESKGRHLLLCPDAELDYVDDLLEAIPVDMLGRKTEKPGIDRAFIIDTCRTHLLRERGAGFAGMKGEQALRNVVEVTGTAHCPLTILCSCAEGRTSPEIPSASQGLFTAALLEALEGAAAANRQVSLSDALTTELEQRVIRLATENRLPQSEPPWIKRSGRPPVILQGAAAPDELLSSTEACSQTAEPTKPAPDATTRRIPQAKRVAPTTKPRVNVELHRAAWQGDVATLKRMVRAPGVNINGQDQAGLTPLHLAIRSGKRTAAQLLLARGADACAAAKGGATPLHDAARGCSANLARLLLDHGANVNAADEAGNTPAHLAAQRGRMGVKVAECLIEAGANLSAGNADRGTPLHEAAWSGDAAMTKALLIGHADPSTENHEASTPLHLAASCGELEVVNVLLATGGAKVNAANIYQDTPLHLAAAAGHWGTTERLIRAGADVNAPDGDGLTPSARAAANGHEKIVLLLRQHGGRQYVAKSCWPEDEPPP